MEGAGCARICVPAARLRHGSAGWSPGPFACPYQPRSPRCCWSRCGSATALDAAGTDIDVRHIRATAIRRAGKIRVDGSSEEFDAVLLEVNFAPGVSAREHRHPGFILGFVVDGQMRSGSTMWRSRSCLRAARSSNHVGLHTSFGSANPDAPVRSGCSWWSPTQPADRPGLTRRARGGTRDRTIKE